MQEELDEWKAAMEKLEVKDIELEEDHIEVVQLVMNPYQLSGSGQTPTKCREVVGAKASSSTFG